MDQPKTEALTEVSQLQLAAFAARERAVQAYDIILHSLFNRRSVASAEVWQQLDEAEATYVESRTALCAFTGQVACKQEFIAAIYIS